MASAEKALAFLLLMAALQLSYAAVYKVGDSAGWTTIGNVDYKQWSATKTFHVGDIILFEYNAQFHNVMRVTHAEYKTCNTSSPLATYTTGNDSITISTRAHHYFFCGVPGHCQAGQKVDINVLRTSSMAPSPSTLPNITTPSGTPATSTPSVTSPGPSPSHAVSLKAFKRLLRKLGLAFAIFAGFVFGFA